MQNATTERNKEEWDLVVQHLHYTGDHYGTLTDAQHRRVRRLGDGFGAGVTDPDMLYDWSHIRDSSPAAVTAMADAIRRINGAR